MVISVKLSGDFFYRTTTQLDSIVGDMIHSLRKNSHLRKHFLVFDQLPKSRPNHLISALFFKLSIYNFLVPTSFFKVHFQAAASVLAKPSSQSLCRLPVDGTVSFL